MLTATPDVPQNTLITTKARKYRVWGNRNFGDFAVSRLGGHIEIGDRGERDVFRPNTHNTGRDKWRKVEQRCPTIIKQFPRPWPYVKQRGTHRKWGISDHVMLRDFTRVYVTKKIAPAGSDGISTNERIVCYGA